MSTSKRTHDDAFLESSPEPDTANKLLGSQLETDDSEKLAGIQCVICLDSPTDLTATSCGHIFCYTCLTATLAAGEQMQPKQSRCPICRHKIQKKDIRPLEIKVKQRPK